jgi:hypothetical protein
VVDSDIADLKFIFEVTEHGCEQHEFLSRMLAYKKDPLKVVSYIKCLRPLSPE